MFPIKSVDKIVISHPGGDIYRCWRSDEEEENREAEARDDFMMCFVGPTPAAIMQVQRDLLVQDVVHVMERHFDAAELGDVVASIDTLFTQRFDALVNSMQLGRPPRGHGGSGHGGGRKPRHLH